MDTNTEQLIDGVAEANNFPEAQGSSILLAQAGSAVAIILALAILIRALTALVEAAND